MRIVGDCREVLRDLPKGSVQCCVTSPPYWGLRDYGTARWEGGDGSECEHRQNGTHVSPKSTLRNDGRVHKGPYHGEKAVTEGLPFKATCAKCGARRVDSQIGLERTPEEFVQQMVEVFRLVREVLADDGTLWLNLGDSYVANGSNQVPQTKRHTGSGFAGPNRNGMTGLKPKDLCGMPWRVAFALQADGWYLRSDIIWHKPNPMPESVTDRPTKSHEYLFLLTKRANYFYDAQAVKEGATPQKRTGIDGYATPKHTQIFDQGIRLRGGPKSTLNSASGGTRNRRTVWTIATAPFKGAHFATFPPKLIEPCILAGTSEKGHCPECGARWERVVDVAYENPGNRTTNGPRSKANAAFSPSFDVRLEKRVTTLGWRPTCAHNRKPIPDVVLDPFAGAGTTGMVAEQLGRKFVGIELNPEYSTLARERGEVNQSEVANHVRKERRLRPRGRQSNSGEQRAHAGRI